VSGCAHTTVGATRSPDQIGTPEPDHNASAEQKEKLAGCPGPYAREVPECAVVDVLRAATHQSEQARRDLSGDEHPFHLHTLHAACDWRQPTDSYTDCLSYDPRGKLISVLSAQRSQDEGYFRWRMTMPSDIFASTTPVLSRLFAIQPFAF
jgi:hypothetical protein